MADWLEDLFKDYIDDCFNGIKKNTNDWLEILINPETEND